MFGFITNNLFFIVPSYFTTFLLFFGVLLVKALASKIALLKPLLTSIDCDLTFFDGRRLIGDHKPVAGWVMPLIAALASYLFFGRIMLMVAIAYFSFFGDLAGSFLKRRLNIEEHKPLIIADQLSFFLAAYAAAFFSGVRIPANELVTLIMVTFAVHFSANLALFKLKLKARPY